MRLRPSSRTAGAVGSRRAALALLLAALVLPWLAGCEEGGASQAATGGELILYCGRSKSLVQPVIDRFEAETGIRVRTRFGNSSQLAVSLVEEGRRSPADAFWSQDVGSLSPGSRAGLFVELPEALVERVPRAFRSPSGAWVATSGRARVLAYSPERVAAEDLPRSLFDLTDSRWSGRVGWAPTNASFQTFITAMRAIHGEDRTRQWLRDMRANRPKSYPANSPIIEALAAGEIDLGLPNHYYLLRYKDDRADFPVEQAFFEDGDIGNLVMTSGFAVLETSPNREAAEAFASFLLSDWAQRHFTDEVFEYPLVEGVEPHENLATEAQLRAASPEVDGEDLEDMEGTLELLREVGLL